MGGACSGPSSGGALVERCNQLGALLPRQGNIRDVLADPATRAEIELVLAEMPKGQAEIEGFLDRERAAAQMICGALDCPKVGTAAALAPFSICWGATPCNNSNARDHGARRTVMQPAQYRADYFDDREDKQPSFTEPFVAKDNNESVERAIARPGTWMRVDVYRTEAGYPPSSL
jgi:hypothetical protein